MNDTVALCLIAALAENDVIGRDGGMPWHLPNELAYFKRMTMGKPVLMGRRTFQSIGRPLPGRVNMVLTSDEDFSAGGVRVFHDLESALAAARREALEKGVDEIMVIGGATLYAATLPMADRLYLTRIHRTYEGDTFFPRVSEASWRLLRDEERPGDPPYSLQVYHRRD